MNINPDLDLTRRELLQRSGTGLGSVALAWLLGRDSQAQQPAHENPLAPKTPHFTPRAKNVIFLHMVGAPSQLDLFDYKPVLQQHNGEECPAEYLEGQRFAFIRGTPKLLGTSFNFERHGESGIELSELLPHLAGVADKISVVKTLHSELINHAPAQVFAQTGFGRFGRPSVGAWTTYGLGSENDELPAFVVLVTGKVAGAGSSLWGSGFLPTVHQGVEFRSQGDPVLFLSNPRGVTSNDRRRLVDDVNSLNEIQLADVGDPEIATRIAQYELAFRMQSSVPELMDTSDEPAALMERYGAQQGRASFANNCVLARRLVERGVRFIQLYDADWDHHGSIISNLPKKCQQVDQPIAALISDLEERGLLDETLIVWASEFGRTPMLQGNDGDGNMTKAGRDHHVSAYCAWMAGGGVKPGMTVGRTDELGYYPVEDPVSVHDFHATILHLLGMDHEHLTYRYQGRNYRLTDIAGNVIEKLIE